ncbi:MAG: hypothetical protein WBC91_07695 [Phototrophicaceae bacterium]
MKVETLLENMDDLINTEIDIEGYIMVLERAKRQVAFVSSSQDMRENHPQQVFIDHSLAELRSIIRPLPTMQLMFRGVMTNPPYIYCFYAEFRATLLKDDDVPILSKISTITIDIPYAGKLSEFVPSNSYHYQAKIDYTPTTIDDQTTRATITSQKIIKLEDDPLTIDTIMAQENRYARRLTGNTIRISGWLENIAAQNEAINHLVMCTASIRLSVITFGSTHEEISIWLPPSDLYTVIKSLSTLKTDEPLRQAIDIIGTLDYINDDSAPQLEEKLPKLTFTHISTLILHDVGYLW